jgi:hypothetical protein
MEGALLAANIRRMYGLIDEFRVVIGAANAGSCYRPPIDNTSAAFLKAIPDPEHKIHIVSSEAAWLSKEIMARVATNGLKADILLHLDADEFWRIPAFKAAVNDLANGTMDRIRVPHIIYFGDCQHMEVSIDGHSPLFCPVRLMKMKPDCIIKHLGAGFTDTSGRMVGTEATVLSQAPLWHFAWIGDKRVLRKLAYYTTARHLNLFSAVQWKQAKARNWNTGSETFLTNIGPVAVVPCSASLVAPPDIQQTVLEAVGDAKVTG